MIYGKRREVLCGAETGFSEGNNVLVSIEKKENYISIKRDDSQLEEQDNKKY